jgi:hypothetical protein
VFSLDDPPHRAIVWPWQILKLANPQPFENLSLPAAAKQCHDFSVLGLQALESAARRGSPDAAFFLQNLARMACAALATAEKDVPEFMRTIASHHYDWPMLAGPSAPYRKEMSRRMETLALGSEAPLNVARGGKKPDYFQHEPYPTLAKLFDYVQACQMWYRNFGASVRAESIPALIKQAGELAPLSPATAEAWFAVMWEILYAATGEKPETHRELHRLGKSRALYNAKHGPFNPQPGTQAAIIRNAIKQRLKRDFRMLVDTGVLSQAPNGNPNFSAGQP